MKDELIAILPDLKQAVEQGIAYAGDLFNRAVSYYTLISIISIVIGALLLIGAIIGIFKAIKWCKNKDNDWLYNESALNLVVISSATFIWYYYFKC